ncbi:MAG: nitroreductase family protein [Proteobacteria bacterium]|nr:nitroreductase family protein [Pseudomonadota bacterium]MBU4472470.1 nitroreductase family protein [Pseudomonadota bacterium]MCG2751297.1 nitroreductase family protein [Desulfobacteraceae bacterium]
MTLIKIDEAKCKKDGLCVQECAAGFIRQRDNDSFPRMISRGEQACSLCGHCVAICPHDALHHEKIPMEDSPPILKELAISQEQAVQFLRSRRSIRRYKNKPVEKETIQFLIDTARYAPTGSNSQLVTWTVFTDEAKIKNIADLTIDWMRQSVASTSNNPMASYLPMIITAYEAGINSITHNAPCLIFASAPDSYDNGMVDLSIALSYFELVAVSAGLGTCWLGLITRALKAFAPLKEMVGLPESHTQFYPMVLGYPKFNYHRLPERKPARIFWKE